MASVRNYIALITAGSQDGLPTDRMGVGELMGQLPNTSPKSKLASVAMVGDNHTLDKEYSCSKTLCIHVLELGFQS